MKRKIVALRLILTYISVGTMTIHGIDISEHTEDVIQKANSSTTTDVAPYLQNRDVNEIVNLLNMQAVQSQEPNEIKYEQDGFVLKWIDEKDRKLISAENSGNAIVSFQGVTNGIRIKK